MAAEPIGVDCLFQSDGSVRIRRISVKEKWEPVEQGRQWSDEEGRHVLVLRPGQEVRHLTLNRETLVWHMQERRQRQKIV